MKIVYSQLQKLLPSLKDISPRQIGDRLTYLGHFNNSIEKKKGEQVISLEVRQNRGDCLSYYGIAKELSVLYGPLALPATNLPSTTKNYQLPIKVTTPKNVYRIQALRISNLKNQPSSAIPEIKKILELHEINTVNALVDITNYITFFWGIPCHAFDTKKSGQKLIWEQNKGKYQKFTTLDGTILALQKNTLMINSPKKAMSLDFLGGQACAIKTNTTETIIEMAIYNPTRVRLDSQALKTVTEAGIRLDKFLDPELIPPAFAHLTHLILKHCGGQITSNLFQYYPQKQKPTPKPISFDPKKPSIYAGIPIKTSFALKVLKDLDCQIQKKNQKYLITPPTLRKDIYLEEDLIEEVIRYHGYEKIPQDQPISSKKLPDITPPVLYIIHSIQNILTNLGYDEIRSWPLITEAQITNPSTVIRTQNSINSEYPALRQSIIPSLINQKQQYHRFKLENQQFFEIGKIYYQEKAGDYQEKYSLAFHHPNQKHLETDLNTLLAQLRLNSEQLIDSPLIQTHQDNTYVEIILDNLSHIIDTDYLLQNKYFAPKKSLKSTAYELSKQIVILDANVTTKTKLDPKKLLKKYSKKLGKNLWHITITDIYHDNKKNIHRYTFRVSYFNLNDKSAKNLHLKTFNLK